VVATHAPIQAPSAQRPPALGKGVKINAEITEELSTGFGDCQGLIDTY
jgi:hypothetical protein